MRNRAKKDFAEFRLPWPFKSGGRKFGAKDKTPRRMNRNSLENLRPHAPWREGESGNAAGRALWDKLAHITEHGLAALRTFHEQVAEGYRQAERKKQEREEEIERAKRAEPEAISPHDWHGQRVLARHPEQAPQPDKFDWAAQRQAMRSSNVSGGHHGAGRRAEIRRAEIRKPRGWRPPVDGDE